MIYVMGISILSPYGKQVPTMSRRVHTMQLGYQVFVLTTLINMPTHTHAHTHTHRDHDYIVEFIKLK